MTYILWSGDFSIYVTLFHGLVSYWCNGTFRSVSCTCIILGVMVQSDTVIDLISHVTYILKFCDIVKSLAIF